MRSMVRDWEHTSRLFRNKQPFVDMDRFFNLDSDEGANITLKADSKPPESLVFWCVYFGGCGGGDDTWSIESPPTLLEKDFFGYYVNADNKLNDAIFDVGRKKAGRKKNTWTWKSEYNHTRLERASKIFDANKRIDRNSPAYRELLLNVATRNVTLDELRTIYNSTEILLEEMLPLLQTWSNR